MADVAWPANIRIGRTSVGLHALCADLNPNAAAMGGDLLDTSDVLFLCFLQTVTIPVVCDTAHVRSLVVVGLGIALPANVHDTPKTKEACGVWGSDVGTV